MKSVELTGRSLEEILENAKEHFGVDIDKLEYELLKEPKKGLFGFVGGNQAEAKVWVKEDQGDKAVRFLKDILVKMDIPGEILTKWEGSYLQINISGGDELALLIGRRGRTLDSLQYLVNLVANKNRNEHVRIILDAADYRKRRVETLQALADRMINKVRERGHSVVLEPMSPQERRIIHLSVQEEAGVISYSEGEEPYRKVVIDLQNK